ncbi:MAG: hypothetical protein ACLFQS_04195 [Bacteroidales bacterium]
MNSNDKASDRLLFLLIEASAGNFRQFQISFWGQIILGFLYSFGYFASKIAGFILGFFMPVLWVIVTYRYLYYKSKKNTRLPFPKWMRTNPGNSLVIILDVIFLGLIWTIILSGWYEPVWIKAMFTMVFPVLTLSMLRNLIIYPFPSDNEENERTEQDDIREAYEQATREEELSRKLHALKEKHKEEEKQQKQKKQEKQEKQEKQQKDADNNNEKG